MPLTLTETDWDQLHPQAPLDTRGHLALEGWQVECVSGCLGRGHSREIELSPGVLLDCSDRLFYQDLMRSVPVHLHRIQCSVMLMGREHSDRYPTFDKERGYFSGSGIAPAFTEHIERSQRQMELHIHLLPEVFAKFYTDLTGADDPLLKLLLKQEEWKVSFFPPVTAAARRLAQQIWQAPFWGATQRLYLQAKVFDLLALQLQPMLTDLNLTHPVPGRKADTIARIYHAQEILQSRLEQPPGFLELAKLVGVSDRTLRRSFQNLFGTTVVGYLTQQRMQQAEQRLRAGDCTVAEVAIQVGYAHLGHFAAGFKRQFGVTPSECLAGKRSVG
ncbi:MAG: helix-turn-helix transcriptional regulator [Acaryochloridaceae cyanobacterium CSU_3_4]|nr:helix-turn-helix transcriptional regulator [Acaryochloridaceae cyanobacterium CSU_3_4]